MKQTAQFLISLALPLLLACGDDTPTEPRSDFPRSFSARSVECTTSMRSGFFSDSTGDFFVEETVHTTWEESADELFAGPASIFIGRIYDTNTGEFVRENHYGRYRLTAVGHWRVTIVGATDDEAFAASGTGSGDRAGRSIEFDMEALPGGCGFMSSGTIR